MCEGVLRFNRSDAFVCALCKGVVTSQKTRDRRGDEED